MTAHSATEFVAARAFVLCYSPAWTPEAEALVAKVMMRDAIAAGLTPSAPVMERSRLGRFTRAGDGARSRKARELIAQGATPEAVAKATGLSWRTVSGMFKESGKVVRKPMPMSEAGKRARQMAADGAKARAIMDATGVSESTAYRLTAAARRAAA